VPGAAAQPALLDETTGQSGGLHGGVDREGLQGEALQATYLEAEAADDLERVASVAQAAGRGDQRDADVGGAVELVDLPQAPGAEARTVGAGGVVEALDGEEGDGGVGLRLATV